MSRKCHTLQRQNTEISKLIFPEKECRGLSPNFHIHASESDLYNPTIGLPIQLEEICRPILGLYKSLTDTWMWKLGLRARYSQKRNTEVGFSLQCSTVICFVSIGAKFGICAIVGMEHFLKLKFPHSSVPSTHFSFNKCTIETHDGANANSALFETKRSTIYVTSSEWNI